MLSTITVIFDGEVFRPETPIDLESDRRYVITIQPTSVVNSEFNQCDQPSSADQDSINYKPASGRSLLRHAGKWVGDDLLKCQALVKKTRGKVFINKTINPFE